MLQVAAVVHFWPHPPSSRPPPPVTARAAGSGYSYGRGRHIRRRIHRYQVERHAQPKAQGLEVSVCVQLAPRHGRLEGGDVDALFCKQVLVVCGWSCYLLEVFVAVAVAVVGISGWTDGRLKRGVLLGSTAVVCRGDFRALVGRFFFLVFC